MNIDDLADRHLGQRCFVLGGGPSLASQFHLLPQLATEITISCNRGFLLWPHIGAPTRYWTVEDHLDAQQFAAEFRALTGTFKLIPDDLAPYDITPSITFPFIRDHYDPAITGPLFGLDPPFFWGGTVSYLMIQLAAYMGCNPIYLLGHDFSYAQHEQNSPSSTEVWRVGATDPSHFDPSYWPPGSVAFAANLPVMYAAFQTAKMACDMVGVKVVNLTPGTALDVFETGRLEDVL